MDQVQKRIKIKTGYLCSGDSTIEVPIGYEFLKLIPAEGYNNYIAIFIEKEEMSKALEALENKYKAELEESVKRNDIKLKETIDKMDLEQQFSDLIKEFKIGDNFYFYDDYKHGDDDAVQENHIKRETIQEIVLHKSATGIKTEDNPMLVVRSWGGVRNLSGIFKTEEEALMGTREYHEQRMKDKEEVKRKTEEENKKREAEREAEILRKAEEIKNRKS